MIKMVKTFDCLICGYPYHYKLMNGGVCRFCWSDSWRLLRDRRKGEGVIPGRDDNEIQ